MLVTLYSYNIIDDFNIEFSALANRAWEKKLKIPVLGPQTFDNIRTVNRYRYYFVENFRVPILFFYFIYFIIISLLNLINILNV